MWMILAHVESVHARGAGQILRLGPLLALGLVAVVAGVSRGLGWRSTVRRASAIALLAAGVLHLALFPEHLDEGLAIGVFFLASSIVEVLLAVWVVLRPSSAVTRSVVGVVGVLLVVYVAARIIRLPFTAGPEDVDGIGVVTKALEVLAGVLAVAADRGRRWHRHPLLVGVDGTAAAALALAVVAVAARPLLGEGPEALLAVTAIAAASTVAMLLGERTLDRLMVAVADGAVLAFLARGPWWASALALPAVAELFRTVTRRTDMRIITPLAVTLLVGLELPALSERLEVLHVGHASDPVGALTVFLLAVVLSVAVWRRGQLPLTIGFLATHLGGQALRLLGGRTSLEAVEIPAASLGLLLLAAVVLADPDLRAPWPLLAELGLASGTLDVILRDRQVAYAPVVAIVAVPVLVGVWHAYRQPINVTPTAGGVLHPPPR